jgi:VanZ family protein
MLIIYYLAFTKVNYQIETTFNDKINHAFAFFCLSFARHFSFPRWKMSLSIGFLILYGISIELIQYFLPWRDCSFWDLVADSVGILIYIVFCSKIVDRKLIHSANDAE